MQDKADLRSLDWLYSQLPILEKAQVITPETSEKIRAHYGELPQSKIISILQIIFGILGAALVAGGIILIIAHNWDDLPRVVRVILSFAPVILAQLIYFFTLWKKPDSIAWVESTSLFLALMIGASISLVSQTYHIEGNFQSFVFTWLLLVLPLIYIRRSGSAVACYIFLVILWSMNFDNIMSEYKRDSWVWVKFVALYAVFIPRWVLEWKEEAMGWRNILTGWLASVGLLIACITVIPHPVVSCTSFIYGSLFAVFYALDKYFGREDANPFKRPLYLVGGLGILIYVFIAGYRQDYDFYCHEFGKTPAILVPILLSFASLYLFVRTWRRKLPLNFIASLFPLILILSQLVGDGKNTASIVMNVYGLLLGIGCVMNGLETRRWIVTNAGIMLISALVLARFFSDQFGFIVRGVVFILLGIGFLFVNYLLWRRTQEATK